MNKAEFITKLADELKATKTEASKNFEAIIKCIMHALKEHDELRFIGFGTFKAKQIEAKEVKTPKGEIAVVPAQRRITFSVGKEFKDVVNSR